MARKNRRRAARVLAFQTLFELESRSDTTLDEVLARRFSDPDEDANGNLTVKAVEFATQLTNGVLESRPALDDRIAAVAPAFPVDQLATTDRVAMEIAIYELLHGTADASVVINEAVELAKTFGSENSGRFVNGVLGTIVDDLTDKPAAEKLQTET